VTVQRGDLDLGKLLGPDVSHYRDALAGRDPGRRVQGVPVGPSSPEVRVSGPYIERFGEELPELASSCTELDISPQFCWDVCGYYAALSVPWTATRSQLMEAYHHLGGPDDERLTYILKQLIRDHGEVRWNYDRQPLGAMFKWDRDVETYLLRLAERVADRNGVSQEEILQEWGLEYRQRHTPNEGVEGPQQNGLDYTPDEDQHTVLDSDWLGEWGWYGLNLLLVPARAGEILAEWQRLLAAEFSARGLRVKFAVGLGQMTEWSSGPDLHIGPNGSVIVFISAEQPNPSMAIKAADGYQSLPASQKEKHA
jgi:hypothetical protein